MSTLTTTNISDGTDTVETEYVTHGSAKAWCNFNMVTATLDQTFNCSSYTDESVGYCSMTFTSNLADMGSASATQWVNHRYNTIVWAFASAITFQCANGNSGWAFVDANLGAVTVNGDLA